MHIHLPKPLHGWKEFANEIFVIVVGVLIALGFEQVVEELHWQHKVQEGEERLRGEARKNFQVAAESLIVTPCVNAQIEALMLRLRGEGSRLDPAPMTELARLPGLQRVIMLPFRQGANQVWHALQIDGTANHLDKDRQQRLNGMYDTTEQTDQLRDQMQVLRDQLDVMSEPLSLDPQIRKDLLQSLHQFRALLIKRRLLDRQTLIAIREAGYGPAPRDIAPFLRSSEKVGTIGFCKAHALPLADYNKEAAAEAPFFDATTSRSKD